MDMLTLGFIFLATVAISTFLLLLAPFKQLDISFLMDRHAKNTSRNDSLLKSSNIGWEEVLRGLGPVKALFHAASNKSKPSIGLDDWSFLDATERMRKVGDNLASSCGTLSQALTALCLVQTSAEIRGHLIGEVDGLKSETIQSIANSLDDIFIGVREKKASLLYDSLMQLIFSSRENVGVTQINDRGNKEYSKNFKKDLDELVEDHFSLGKYDALDKFIKKWSTESIKNKDIHIYAIVSFLDEYQSELSPLSKTLKKAIRQKNNLQIQEGRIITEGLQKFGDAYNKQDKLTQFREITKLMHEFNQ